MVRITKPARAKINLALHVTGKRDDGYHLLDSLVVFAKHGDVLHAELGDKGLSVSGPFSSSLSSDADNLVQRAAALFPRQENIKLHLEKNLPVASGIGGGSADAAATLLAISELTSTPLPSDSEALKLGADVPVCLANKPCRMSGIGEVLDDAPPLPKMPAVLVNPLVEVSTPSVFKALESTESAFLPTLPSAGFASVVDFAGWLKNTRNDLEQPARSICPIIDDCLDALNEKGPLLSRMSGSGATTFALYQSQQAADSAAKVIKAHHPDWWTVSTTLNAPQSPFESLGAMSCPE